MAMRTRKLMCAFGAASLALAVGLFCVLPANSARAEETMYATAQGDFTGVGAGTEIERLSAEFESAQAAAVLYHVKAAANEQVISVLEGRLPALQARSDAAMVEMYKMQQSRYDIVEMLLASESLDDFINQSEYVERISRTNLKAINELGETCERLQAVRESVNAAKAESDARLSAATEALESARSARAARAAAGLAGSGVSNDGADWHMDEDEFVSAWAPRIDAYLAGSPLAGQGENFARSSWRYCVDPRWSPAISNTESSKGTYCIRPHNAWGWGAADSDPYNLALEWSSWEEAIDAHVRGLSEGFGYTISLGAAQSYCPPTWEDWYEHTRSEMELI